MGENIADSHVLCSCFHQGNISRGQGETFDFSFPNSRCLKISSAVNQNQISVKNENNILLEKLYDLREVEILFLTPQHRIKREYHVNPTVET